MTGTRKSVLLLNKDFEHNDKPSGSIRKGARPLLCAFSETSVRRPSCSTSPTFCSFLQDDLLSLKVVSVLHHLSIKRAIQVLRINNFEPNCLRRRPSDEVAFELRVTPHAPSTHTTVLCAKLKPISSWKLRGGLLVSSEPHTQPHLRLRLCFPVFLPFLPWWFLPVSRKPRVVF